MALTALGLAFFGAYYVVGVAVGRVKKTQLNWIVTGFAAIVNVALLIVLVPDYGATGAGAASAIAYFLMAILMIARGNRVFPVGYDWGRLAGLCVLAGVLFALGRAALQRRRRGRRRGAPRRGRAVRPARAQRRSGSAPRSASAVTAACSLGARAGAESPRAASNTRSPARAKALGVGTGSARPHQHEAAPERRHVVVVRQRRAEALVALVARAAQRDVPAVRDRAVQALQRAHDQRPARSAPCRARPRAGRCRPGRARPSRRPRRSRGRGRCARSSGAGYPARRGQIGLLLRPGVVAVAVVGQARAARGLDAPRPAPGRRARPTSGLAPAEQAPERRGAVRDRDGGQRQGLDHVAHVVVGVRDAHDGEHGERQDDPADDERRAPGAPAREGHEPDDAPATPQSDQVERDQARRCAGRRRSARRPAPRRRAATAWESTLRAVAAPCRGARRARGSRCASGAVPDDHGGGRAERPAPGRAVAHAAAARRAPSARRSARRPRRRGACRC